MDAVTAGLIGLGVGALVTGGVQAVSGWLDRARAKDLAEPVPPGRTSNFNPSADILDKYLLQTLWAMYLSLRAAYTRKERRKEPPPALQALARELE
jgi:hypothetical protein